MKNLSTQDERVFNKFLLALNKLIATLNPSARINLSSDI